MACKLSIKADNGENSILFKSIADVVADPQEAVDIYFYTKTDAFKKMYGHYDKNGFDKSKIDVNGEPKYSSFSEEGYTQDVDYNKIEMDNKAKVYKLLLERIPEIEHILDSRIRFLESDKASNDDNKSYLQGLKDIKNIMATKSINESLPRFLEMSNQHLRSIKRRANKALLNPESSIKELASYYKISQSYAVISELSHEMEQNPEVANIFTTDLESMDKSVSDIQKISGYYITKSIEYLTDEFSKRDPNWSRAKIKENLTNASRDITFMEQMFEYVGDSQDRVISMVGKIMLEAEHNIRRESIQFTKNLQERLEALEKSSTEKGSDVFKKIIFTAVDGSLHYLDPNVKFTNGKDKNADKMYNQLLGMKGDQQLMEFLTFFDQSYSKLNSMLPAKARMGTRLPSVLISDWERMSGKSLKEKAELFGDAAKKTITRSNLDMERGMLVDDTGKPVKRIPTFYTQKFDSVDYNSQYQKDLKALVKAGIPVAKAEETAKFTAEKYATEKMAQLMTKDLASSLQAFHAMAINYSAKNELINVFESALAVVGSNKRKYTQVDSGGRIIKDAITGRTQTIGGEKTRAKAQLEVFLDMQLYGQKEKDLGYIDMFGAKIDTNSVLRKLNNSTSLIQLSANVLSGISNIGNGEYNNFMEAVGGEFFTTKDLAAASGEYKNNIGGLLTDIGQRTPNNIVNLLEEEFNFLQSFGGPKMTSTERSTARRLMKTDAVFFVQSSGEHFMQVRAGLAMLNNVKTYDKSGVENGNVRKAFTAKDGKLIQADVYVKNAKGDLVKLDNNEKNRISNKITAVLRSLHGNYSSQTATEMKQDARLALVMKFRDWMYPGIKRRFQKKREYHMQEQEMEGFYRTGVKALKVLAMDLTKLNLQMTKENWANLSSHEKANIRRAITEAATISLLAIAGAMLGKAGKLMDDEFGSEEFSDRMVLGSFNLLTYEVNRLYTEVFAYLNPVEAVRLMRTPMASTSIVENLIKLMGQIATDPFEQYETGWRDGQYKVGVRFEKLIPIYKQVAVLNADGIKDMGTFYQQ